MKKELYPLLVAITMLLPTSIHAQWVEKNNGLWGGRVHAFAVDGDNIFAGTEGGVFFSSNNGTTWTSRSTGLTSLRIRGLAIIGSNIFAATYGGGVFRSTNYGINWVAVNTGLGFGGSSITINSLFAKGSNLFAGGDGEGAFLSTNNGDTWIGINTGIGNYINTFAVSGDNIFAGTSFHGVFLSTNNGSSWSALNTGLTDKDVQALAISGGNIFAGTEGGGVFLSTNNGASWAAVNTGLSNLVVNTLVVNGSDIYAGTNGGMFLSTNNGASWTAINNGINNGLGGGFSIYSSVVKGDNVFIGTGGVFYSSDKGANWTAASIGISSSTVWTLLNSGSSIFAGTIIGSGLSVSSNNGDSWLTSNSGLSLPYITSSAKIGNNLFVGGFGVFLSTNNGISWSSVNTGLTGQAVRALASSGSNLFAGTNGGVFISENNGASWKAVNAGLTENYIECLATGGSNIFAGTRDGVFRSIDNGANWTSEGKSAMQFLNIPPYIVSMAVMGSTIFAATYENGLFRSLDNGTSWVKILDEDNIHLLTLDDGSIFAGNTNVFVSTDNGTNWVTAGTGLPSVMSSTIYSMAVNDSHLFAGTLFKGVWSRPLSEFPIPQPVVTFTSFAPASGPEGTLVTINGTNFSTTPSNNSVKFNGTTANVTASTATSITAIVPVGATTGPVTVTTARGGSATSSTNFTVTVPTQPEINIKQNNTNIASSGSYAFGNQDIGSASTSVTVTIENTGTGVLNLTSSPKVIISGANANEFIVNQPASTTVASGATTTFLVTFSPSTASGKTAQLSIANNDSDENPYIVNLTGTGTCSNPTKPIITQVNNSDFTSSTLTSSSAPAGGTYQWFVNGTAIANAASQSYTTSASGSYSVRITVAGGCSSTSDPFVIVVTAVEPPIVTGDFSIYPNPANDWLTLTLGKMAGKKDITIYQATGNQMAVQGILGNEVNLYVGDYPAGMYIVKVSTFNSVGALKFIKK